MTMNAPYVRLGITLALGAVAMFAILSAMLGAPAGATLATACIALMLVAPIGVLILLFMPHVFRRLGANLALYAAFTAVFLGGWAATHGGALADDRAALQGAAADRLASASVLG